MRQKPFAGIIRQLDCIADAACRARHHDAHVNRICPAGLSHQSRRQAAAPVDADRDYGNALDVKRTVEELKNAGVADNDNPSPDGLDRAAITRHIAPNDNDYDDILSQ
jgi:hypothetical protein